LFLRFEFRARVRLDMTDPKAVLPSAPTAGLEPTPAAYQRLVEGVRDYAISMLDPHGIIVSWNAGGERIKGYAEEEIIGRHFSAFHTEEAIARNWPAQQLELAAQQGRVEDEGWRVRKDGSRFWANVVLTAIRDDAGRLLGFSKITADLTKRHENEELLRHKEERLRLLIENVTDYAIFMLDPSGNIVSWNAGAERFKGYKAAEIIGKHFSVFYPREALDAGWPAHELEYATKTGRFEDEGWRLRKDGTRFWANVVITALRDRSGVLRGFSKITRDLTERREAQEELRRSEERFRLLLEGIEDYAIIMLDQNGCVASWNAGAQRINGYTAEEIIGHSIERFYSPEDVAAGRPADELRNALLHRRVEDLGWRVRKDGTRYWADVIVTALHDNEGRLRGFAKVTRDLTERKRMENLEEQGRHLTEFLAMLAHELRNPLAPIRNALSIVAMNKEVPPQVAWSHGVIERQVGHLTRLVDDLLDVSRITRGKLRMRNEPMDMNAAVHRAIESSRPLVDARKHRLEIKLAPHPLLVHGDLTRLTQVVLNLVNNAAKYTPEGGEIEIESAAVGADVEVRVRDNGVGISPGLLDHIFDLFAQGERTIDRSEGGLGIGLTLARRIVELHGGSITARSEGAGRGAEFALHVPRLTLEMEAGAAHADAGLAASTQKRRVLVVDDNVDAADSMAMLLRMVGHEVAIEHEGNAALARATRESHDIILLDIGLPGMNGYDVARHLRARPEGQNVRIYALTGYGQEEDRRRSLASGFDGHLVKPVMPAELLALMDGPPT
jgi:PAS domain S-box-containing protein